jgi:Histidine kinase
MFGRHWRRFAVTLSLSTAIGLMLVPFWTSGAASVLTRTFSLGAVATLVFALFEQWPKRLPRWLMRWVLQVTSVGLSMPLATITMYVVGTSRGAPPFWRDADRLGGFLTLMFLSVLIAPWMALAALIRQKEAFVREQALAFQLERSELERQALDARLHLLQAQVAPHFLFNTLANVQALVETHSPRASVVLGSLVAYLRATVPLLDAPAATIARELQMVKAYLELMHMRMPDRLTYDVVVADSTLALRCPPATLLTLVENAVRHGIDPSEKGGHIDVSIGLSDNRCAIRVVDDGVGLRGTSYGLGTGLATLRERLHLEFAGDAHLSITARESRGVCAELDIPAVN